MTKAHSAQSNNPPQPSVAVEISAHTILTDTLIKRNKQLIDAAKLAATESDTNFCGIAQSILFPFTERHQAPD